MFPSLTPFHFSDRAAADLVATMENPTPDPPGVDQGTADDSPTLPSEYTYLGQFVDHNLDFDDTPQPTADVNASSLSNYESFRFDLNNLFGGGPSVDPQLYGRDGEHLRVQGTLGTPSADGFPTVTDGNPNGVFDLARNPVTGVADLVEPRDDENQILSQITAAFAAFYNDFINDGMQYAQARQLTEDYYQEIVLTDLLPAYVGQTEISKYLQRVTSDHTGSFPDAKPDKGHSQNEWTLTTPDFPDADFTPIEFSVGAYRFGHSLVREIYHINDIDPTTIDLDDNVAIFDLNNFQAGDLNNFQAGDLTGGGQLPGPTGDASSDCTTLSICTEPDPAGHQIQWKYFVPALNAQQNADGLAADVASPQGDTGINFARRTQTTISPALFDLPASTIAGCADAASPVCNGSGDLVSRDFARGNYDGLASGQAIAKAMGCPVIPAAKINPTQNSVFNTGTPLLYYVLAEAQRAGSTLGCVGAGIITQVFLRVLWDTPGSILHTNFTPDPSLVKIRDESATFSFGDLLIDTGLAPRSS
ncbi:MAG: hypothetical protein ABSH51_32635 [Solirubrobacteraceae bacterium]